MPETIPILRSADFDVTTSFWAGLGFTPRGRWEDEYLILRHEDLGIELHFWHDPSADRWTNDVACYVPFGTPGAAGAQHAPGGEGEGPGPGRLSPPPAEGGGGGRVPRD